MKTSSIGNAIKAMFDRKYHLPKENTMSEPVLAESIEQGQCFRKIHGEYVYLAISKSSAKYAGLDETKLHGVCFNGNMASVSLSSKVIPMPFSAMSNNQAMQDVWEENMGCREKR